jgi:hypothetical protein
MSTFARESSQTFPHGATLPLDQGGIELLASQSPFEQGLCLLKRSPGQLACHFHDPFLLRTFDHGRHTQLRPHL